MTPTAESTKSVKIQIRRFSTMEKMVQEAADLLREHLQWTGEFPHGIMLSGGNTPLPVYEHLAAHPVEISAQAYLFPSDERMVPLDSADSNFGNMTRTLSPLQIPAKHLIHVHTDLSLEQAAERFDLDLNRFFENKGSIGLGFLGLGSDGHTASLFNREDVQRGAGRFAMAVPREGMDRVSVTPVLLERIERIVFLVGGRDKMDIIKSFIDSPLSYPAGQAVANARSVELWAA